MKSSKLYQTCFVNNSKALTSIGLVIMLLFSGCALEEGSVSFRSRKNRIDNIWKFNRVYENAIVVTPQFLDQEVEFTSDKAVIFKAKGNIVFQGKWEWHDHYDRIIFFLKDPDGDDVFIEWSIKELSKKSFTAEEFTRGNLMRYELVPIQ